MTHSQERFGIHGGVGKGSRQAQRVGVVRSTMVFHHITSLTDLPKGRNHLVVCVLAAAGAVGLPDFVKSASGLPIYELFVRIPIQ